MIKRNKLLATALVAVMCLTGFTACGKKQEITNEAATNAVSVENLANAATDLKIELDEEDKVTTYSESECVKITLSDNNINVNGNGATVNGSTVEITSAGNYLISGTLSDGCIKVNNTADGTVRLILNGVNVSNSTSEPVIFEAAKKVIVTLADGSENTFSDKSRAVDENDEYAATISSKADMIINGSGKLNVNGNYRNGIKSSDDLYILGGNINVTAVEDGIIGKDRLGITGGTFTVNAGVDALKSNNDSDTSKGYIIVEGGEFNLVSANDAIQAETNLAITGGTFNIKTGDGASVSNNSNMGGGKFFGGDWGATSTSTQTDSESLKGLKAGSCIYIANGTFSLNCEDDAVHCNDTVTINGGTFTMSSSDDAIHADLALQVNGGKIEVTASCEGLEAKNIIINDGDLSIKASDDGLNATSGGGTDTTMMGGGGNRGKNNGNFGGQTNTTSNVTPNDTATAEADSNSSSDNSKPTIQINGGNLFINSDGDGIDSNGTAYINGGNTIVCGPTNDGNGSLDFETTFEFSGGTLMAFGSSGMMERPTSAQNGVCIVTTFTSQSAGTEFKLTDSASNEVVKYTPSKAYSSAVIYSSAIKAGETYTVTAGDVTQTITASEGVNSNNTGNAAGAMPNKGYQNGAMPNGEMPTGAVPEGEMPAGEMPSGEIPTSEMGDYMPGSQYGGRPNR